MTLNFENHPTGFNYMQVVHYYGRLFSFAQGFPLLLGKFPSDYFTRTAVCLPQSPLSVDSSEYEAFKVHWNSYDWDFVRNSSLFSGHKYSSDPFVRISPLFSG
jgi:hypothetical protein